MRVGTPIQLEDAGEGWFPEPDAARLSGTIEADLGADFGGPRWYVVRLDRALETQERGHRTPSGYRLVRHTRVLISGRWQGQDLALHTPAPVYVCLLPEGIDPAEYASTIRAPNLWGTCTVLGR